MSGVDPQRGDYPALATSVSPSSAVQLLNERLQTIAKTNRDVADWLQERRRVEEAYAQGLRKLSRRDPPNATGEDLGIFTASWQRIVGGVATLADSHHTFAQRIEKDVERPLRDFMSNNRESQQLSTVTGNLAVLAKEHAQAQRRAEKARAGTSEEVDNALAQWEAQAPFVFENLQAVDESRLNHLRDLLTQLQTHEVDWVQKSRAAAEACLETLLSVNTADEIQAFTAKNAGAERTASRAERPDSSQRDRMHERRASRFIPTLGNSQNSSAYAPMNGDESAEPEAFREAANTPATPAPEEKKPKGLRRLGTVFSRKNRQSVMLRPTPGRGKSANSQRLGSSTDLTEDPIAENEGAATRERSRDAPQPSPRPPRSSSVRNANGATGSQPPQLAAPVQAPSLTVPDPWYEQPSQAPSAPAPVSQPTSAQPETETFSTPPTSATLDPIAQAQREAALSGEGGADAANKTYNLDIRNAPITEEGSVAADQAMANVASTLRAQAAPPARRAGTVRGRRDVRNTVYVPSDSAPVMESSQSISPAAVAAPAAFTPAAPVLAPAPVISPVSNITTGSAFDTTSPIAVPTHRQFGSEDHTSDTQSVRSGRSMASSAMGMPGAAPTKHLDSTAPGLSSSVVETVSATLEQGAIAKASVQGELALSYNPTTAQGIPANARETIRLDNFPTLEKVAPNPSFVSQRVPGEYNIDVRALALATGQPVHLAHGKPAIAFKYKLHVDAADAQSLARHCPVLLHPSWKHEANQTSVILTYTLNPAFLAAQTGQVSEHALHNVFLVLHLTGAKASSCQSKPAGTFSKRENLLYWRFEQLTLAAGANSQKLIARFATDGAASGGRVEARWEVVTPSAGSHSAVLGVSRLDGPGANDPFADESAAAAAGTWVPVGGARKLVSGSYTAV